MDREHKKHMETVKLLITETIMVIVIIITAVILTFVAMGYNLDKNGELGQSGLVQLRSFPSGASITIDGDTILPRTTTSRMLSAGEHTIKLTKDGYDSWEKTVTSESGRLIKLEYMRLFYQNRVPETMKEYSGKLGYFVPTPNRDYAMLIFADNNVWRYLDLRGDGVNETEIDLTALLNGVEVQEVKWNEDSDKLLVKVLRKNEIEWILINARSPKESVNLTREFALYFSEVRFMTDNGDKLIALENGNLRTIAMSGKTVSQVLIEGVKKYDYTGDYIVALNMAQEMIMMRGDNTSIIKKFSADELVNIAVSDYIGEKYLTVTENNKMTIYRGELPSVEQALSEMEMVVEESIDFVPATVGVYGNNELIVARDGARVVVFDCETRKFYQFTLDSDRAFLIDGYMIGEIVERKLIVMDFDGTNKRELTSADSTALITRNNKWLYYLTLNEDKVYLTREKIVD
ncbi:PEGA domain-containing protein [Candidatus Saccharibacteria bacterium]|nr:PEGA domain-containing protein [Candidatus Saccharibacteria bacterium]